MENKKEGRKGKKEVRKGKKGKESALVSKRKTVTEIIRNYQFSQKGSWNSGEAGLEERCDWVHGGEGASRAEGEKLCHKETETKTVLVFAERCGDGKSDRGVGIMNDVEFVCRDRL
ncbi:Protein of unknown function [Gryllus bimaculatus]|nr:Protein of unknown function [Gryllus bimaculatus]